MLTQLSLFCCWLLPNVELKHFPCPVYWHQHPLSQSIHGTCQRCHTVWLWPDQTGCSQAVGMLLDCTDYQEGLVVLGMACSSYPSPASLTMKLQSWVNRAYARLNYQPLFGKSNGLMLLPWKRWLDAWLLLSISTSMIIVCPNQGAA